MNWAQYQFPVLRQTVVTVEGVVDATAVAFEGDLPPLLTAGGTLALTGGEHQVFFPPLFIFHYSGRQQAGRNRFTQGATSKQGLKQQGRAGRIVKSRQQDNRSFVLKVFLLFYLDAAIQI